MNFSDAELQQLRDRVTRVLEQHPGVVALTPLPAVGVVGQTIQALKDFIGKPEQHLPQVRMEGGSLTVAAGLRVAATSPTPQLLDELAAAVRRELSVPVTGPAPEIGGTASAAAAGAAAGATSPNTAASSAAAATVPALDAAAVQVQLVATSIDQTSDAA